MGQKITRRTQCGNQPCGKQFTYHYNLEDMPAGMRRYDLSCPFCHTRQAVPLHSVRKVEVLRDGTQQELTALTLPEHPVGTVGE